MLNVVALEICNGESENERFKEVKEMNPTEKMSEEQKNIQMKPNRSGEGSDNVVRIVALIAAPPSVVARRRAQRRRVHRAAQRRRASSRSSWRRPASSRIVAHRRVHRSLAFSFSPLLWPFPCFFNIQFHHFAS